MSHHRESAEMYLIAGSEMSSDQPEKITHLLIGIGHLLLSIDDHLERLAEGLTHGPARHTHTPSPVLKAERYDPAEEGE